MFHKNATCILTQNKILFINSRVENVKKHGHLIKILHASHVVYHVYYIHAILSHLMTMSLNVVKSQCSEFSTKNFFKSIKT